MTFTWGFIGVFKDHLIASIQFNDKTNTSFMDLIKMFFNQTSH